MPFQAASRSDEQSEPVIKTITHFIGGHRRHSGGCELDRQGNPIQALADFADSGRFSVITHREVGRHTLSAFREQAHGRRVDPCRGIQGAHRLHLFLGYA